MQVNINFVDGDPLTERFEAIVERIPYLKKTTIMRVLLSERLDLVEAGYDLGDTEVGQQLAEATKVFTEAAVI
jgi:hypothetical protein